MNFDIFDEEYYLQQNPGISAAITQGLVTSGLDHFQRYGLTEGRTKVSRYYNETTYLENNPGVANILQTNIFASGLEHFINYGYEEGRNNTSPDYDETFYLNKYNDVASQVETGTYVSGFSHFIQVGSIENLQTTSFVDSFYLGRNSDVAEAVNNGVFPTGQAHYREYGQFEQRSARFTGTPGSDVILGYGEGEKDIYGVDVTPRPSFLSLPGPDFNNDGVVTPEEASRQFGQSQEFTSSPVVTYSDGSNEFDTLVGSAGQDNFFLGRTSVNGRGFFTGSTTFYQGEGVALIQNFDPSDGDTIKLIIGSSDFDIAEGELGATILVENDPIAIVEGYESSQLTPIEEDFLFYREVTFV
ncbi:MAG: calcium-binding protein [Okeania sp. SIO2D1]|nr:calcium-binding protein [Okeania sp. SIO2D1]